MDKNQIVIDGHIGQWYMNIALDEKTDGSIPSETAFAMVVQFGRTTV